ncbi:MAG: acetyl-CoA carboxylase biotin carboxylase subunit [Halobacteria archaeon]|nr:acetyl-CoA carboxylase biotin carboxylase subunit [Halobacteria archaeon]
MTQFDKVLVANRGEIAIRVLRACRELDIDTVAVYSEVDKEARHVDYADEAYNIGPEAASESYLNQDNIFEVAHEADVDAIHPGYGFLAENADFAERCRDEGIIFIGPPSNAMDIMASKTKAREKMKEAGVPPVPGTTDPAESVEEVKEFGDEYGYPIAIKAAAGGGGKGLRIAHDEEEAEDAYEGAKREGRAYFDDETVYLERYLENPRHIEVQVLSDKHGNHLHLGERDCSIQREHQKIVEETPSLAITDEEREELGQTAIDAAEAVDYTSAGTVEFLYEDGDFYFLEMNTRIQVEHTVTEMVTGIDIVKWQIRIAQGEEIDFDQEDVEIDGASIECRINAEDPSRDFAPTPGKVTNYHAPGGYGVRMDSALYNGYEIVGSYDSMVGKLISWGEDRDEAIKRMRRGLWELRVDGVTTNVPFLELILHDSTFVAGNVTTNYFDEHIDQEDIERAMEELDVIDVVQDEEEGVVVQREFKAEVNGKLFNINLAEIGAGDIDEQKEKQEKKKKKRAEREKREAETEAGEVVSAEMQGTIVEVNVEEGDEVEEGDVICVLEAMKMENDIITNTAGTVQEIAVEEDQDIDMDDLIAVIE